MRGWCVEGARVSWQLMQMWGCCCVTGNFAKGLSQAIFKLHDADVEAERCRLQRMVAAGSMTQTQANHLKDDFRHLRSKCRTTIREPRGLHEELDKVINDFQDTLDPVHGPLFHTRRMAAVHERQLKLVDAGRLSGEFVCRCGVRITCLQLMSLMQHTTNFVKSAAITDGVRFPTV